MEQLDAIFCPPVSAHKTPSFRIAHLWGAKGTGKTALAKHYAELNRHELSFVFWISAESWETAVASYLDFAETVIEHYSRKVARSDAERELGLVGIREMTKAENTLRLDRAQVMSVVGAVKDWLMQPENCRWLVVVDHIVPSYDIHELIPLTLSGKVILTSQDVISCSWGTKIEVTAMTETEAEEMLHSSVGLSIDQKADDRKLRITCYRTHADPTTGEAETALVKRLECHPLRISQAAATIRSKQMPISTYLRKLEERPRPRMFGSAIDQSPMTRKFLRISSMLSSSAIPTTLFSSQLKAAEVPPRFSKAISEMKGKYLSLCFS